MCDTHLTELFGFLKHPYSIEFDGGSVKLTDSYEHELENISNKANSDGYIYLPYRLATVASSFAPGLGGPKCAYRVPRTALRGDSTLPSRAPG